MSNDLKTSDQMSPAERRPKIRSARRSTWLGAGILGAGVVATTMIAPGTEAAPMADAVPLADAVPAAVAAPAARSLAVPAEVIPASVARLGNAEAVTVTTKAEAKADKKRAKKKAARAAAAAEAREQARAIRNAEVIGKRYTTTGVNVRTEPSTDAKVVKTLAQGATVKATDNTQDGFRQIKINGDDAWVKSSYLTKQKPRKKSSSRSGSGTSSAPCQHGSGVESGLTANAIKVHRSVCAAFPSVTSYGGTRGGGGNHGSGRALDIMVRGGTGDAIAAYVRANAKSLGVSEVIWSQKIWTVQRSSEGWRSMSNRGSDTANHYDHVHVSVY